MKKKVWLDFSLSKPDITDETLQKGSRMDKSNSTTDILTESIIHDFTKGISVMNLLLCTCFFGFDLISFLERRKLLFAPNKREDLKEATYLLLLAFFGIWTGINQVILSYTFWDDKTACRNFLVYPYTFGYLSAKQFVYLYLYQRLKIVQKMLQWESCLMKSIRWMIFLPITAGYPIIFYPIEFSMFTGLIIAGFCVQATAVIFPIYLFAAFDLLMNLVLLALFIAPLTKQAQNAMVRHRKLLMKVAKRNLVYSSIMMISTLVYLFYIAINMSQIDFHSNPPTLTVLQALNTGMNAVDTIISISACHAMDTVWIPAWLRTWLHSLFSDHVDDVDSKRRSGRVLMTSLFVKSNGLRVEEEVFFTNDFIEVGHDTLLQQFLPNDFVLKAAKLFSSKTKKLFTSFLILLCIFLDSLVLLQVAPKWVSYFNSVFY